MPFAPDGLTSVGGYPGDEQKGVALFRTVDGKKMKYSDVKKGTELHFYIENKRWGLFGEPNDTAMQILSVDQL